MSKLLPTLWGQVLRLALADLRSEPLLTVCLSGALVAIMIPLLILAGLRTGIIDSLRGNLVNDPVFREIRPTETQAYPESLFTQLRALPNVEFVIEGITLGTSGVVAKQKNESGSPILLDMLPTAAGDPLLTTYGALIPAKKEAVLSASAAIKLFVQKNDEITLEIGRQRNGAREVQLETVRVVGVLPERADRLEKIYLPFPLVRDIEIYREGFSIEARKWPGTPPDVLPGYNGVYIQTPEPLNAVFRSQLLSLTGFFQGAKADAKVYAQRTSHPLPAEQSVFQLSTIDRLAGPEMLERVSGLLLGKNATLLPYVDNLFVKLSQDGKGLSKSFPVLISEPITEDITTDTLSYAIQLPLSLAQWVATSPVFLHLKNQINDVAVPVKVTGTVPGEYITVPAALAGMLQRGQNRRIHFDNASNRLVAARTSYRGFRLYTSEIDTVPETAKMLQKRGIEVVAKVGAIERIQTLDRGLMKLFLLIAVIGGSGAAIVLLINLYAAVERKASEFGHLRLIGLTRKEIFLYPVYQSMVIVSMAIVAASIGSALTEVLINQGLSGQLGIEGSICFIKMTVYLKTAGSALFLALFASLAAAIRVTRIDPADAVRKE